MFYRVNLSILYLYMLPNSFLPCGFQSHVCSIYAHVLGGFFNLSSRQFFKVGYLTEPEGGLAGC